MSLQRTFTVEQALSFARGESEHKSKQIDTTIAYDIIQAMNIILSQFPLQFPGAAPVGRNKYFDYGHDAVGIGGALNAVRGYYSSVRAGYGRLLANINVCTTAFYQEGNLATAMANYLGVAPSASLNQFHVDKLKAFFKGVKVLRVYLKNPRPKAVFSFGSRGRFSTPRTSKFKCEDFGRREEITVEEYFRRKHRINLTYPHLPCVNIGNRDSPVDVPPEQLSILPGQPFKGALSDLHTAEIIKFAARKPTNNARLITTKGMEVLGHTEGSVNIAASFGINVDKHMVMINARILVAPRPQYFQKKAITPRNASWNMSNIKFAQPARVGKIEYFFLPTRTYQQREEFLQAKAGFERELRNCGLSYQGESTDTWLNLQSPNDLGPLRERFSAIGKLTKAQKPSIIIAFVPDKSKTIYGTIKKGGDIIAGVPTICMVMDNVRKQTNNHKEAQYFANVCLKVNLKMGGQNHLLENSQLGRLVRDPSTPIMLMGADVTHPSPGSLKGTPSIASVVASIDGTYSQFPASMRLQESKKEMIDNLDVMVKQRLDEYFRKMKKLPPAILYYRDGVSEGQYNQVLDLEVPQIRKGCEAMNPKWMPKLTVIIVGKRHHTRFYPAQENCADKNFNCVPGTVVDRAVTHVYDFDFYLQAHAGLQGTTKPAHYYVIKDENKFGADEIQQLTHNLCYLYGRATKGVSIVPPAYYADLACERGRFYIHGLLTGTDTQSVSSGGSDDIERVRQRARELWGAGIHRDVISTMFYI